jgi:hypothetical protein
VTDAGGPLPPVELSREGSAIDALWAARMLMTALAVLLTGAAVVMLVRRRGALR